MMNEALAFFLGAMLGGMVSTLFLCIFIVSRDK